MKEDIKAWLGRDYGEKSSLQYLRLKAEKKWREEEEMEEEEEEPNLDDQLKEGATFLIGRHKTDPIVNLNLPDEQVILKRLSEIAFECKNCGFWRSRRQDGGDDICIICTPHWSPTYTFRHGICLTEDDMVMIVRLKMLEGQYKNDRFVKALQQQLLDTEAAAFVDVRMTLEDFDRRNRRS